MATTSKKINIVQLDKELNSHGLICDFNDDKKKIIKAAENSPITEKEIEVAIDAHIANPTDQEIQQLNFEEGVAKLKELGFTDEQIAALIGQ
jgi:hypothetical protein